LRQLQQFFFAQKERDTKGGWNEYGKYWGTSSSATKHHPLTNINMAQANRDQQKPILPDKEKQGVCVSKEQWAAPILKPNISTVLSDAMTDSRTKTRFECAKKPEVFKITEGDYKMTIDVDKIGVPNHTYNITPEQNKKNLKKS
jgi:hypothetical protein